MVFLIQSRWQIIEINYRFRTWTFRHRCHLKGGVRQGCFLGIILNYLIQYIHFHSLYIMSHYYAKFKENPCVGTDASTPLHGKKTGATLPHIIQILVVMRCVIIKTGTVTSFETGNLYLQRKFWPAYRFWYSPFVESHSLTLYSIGYFRSWHNFLFLDNIDKIQEKNK